jgi:type IV pilus assembly protein PilC
MQAQDSMRAELAKATKAIAESLESGSTLSDACRKHPNIFPPVAAGLIEVGESLGTLAPNLVRLAEMLERRVELGRKALAKVIYPAALAAGAIYILPLPILIFAGFLAYLGQVALGTFLLLALAGTAFFGPAVGSALLGRKRVHQVLLAIPVYGAIVKKMALARYTRTLGMAVAAGADMGKGLHLADLALDNAVLEARTSRVLRIIQAQGVAKGLSQAALFSPESLAVIDTGERTGNLGANLQKVADTLDDDAQRAMGYLGRILSFGMFFLAVIWSVIRIFAMALSTPQLLGPM